MTRLFATLVITFAFAPNAPACTFCEGSFRTKQTLRTQFVAAKVVLYGQLKNPRFDPKTDAGFTDFHMTAVLKDDPARKGQAAFTLPKYLPVVGNTPTEFVFFFAVTNGTLDAVNGLPATPAVVEYLKAAAALDDADPVKKLAFFFARLDAADEAVAADAFFEFARSSDTDILKARAAFDPARLRTLLTDPKTPLERLGVFAFLLGACGGPADAAFLADMLKPNPPGERVSAAFGGLLAGYIQLSPKEGWAFTATVLGDPKRGYAERLSAVGTVRFFQATRGDAVKADVLKCCAALLPHGDLADQAIEDLRRWGYWELSAAVFAQFDKPTHAAPLVRRCVVRYAISCPSPEAKQFLEAIRHKEPKLVKSVEEMMAAYAPVPPPKPNP